MHMSNTDSECDDVASPVLRCSTRKRKSTSALLEMSKSSGKKKKNISLGAVIKPDQAKSMPRIPHTPQAGAVGGDPQVERDKDGQQKGPAEGFEALLLAMEKRLTAKMEKTTEEVREAVTLSRLNNQGLGELEARMETNEEKMRTALADTEARITEKVEEQFMQMVNDQLRSAGFVQDLSVGDLSTYSRNMTMTGSRKKSDMTYTSIAAASRPNETGLTKQDRQTKNFWKCRRALRLWPIKGNSRLDLEEYLVDKLRMDKDQAAELGDVAIQRILDKRNKYCNEAVIYFDDKSDRDSVKMLAVNLANYKDEEAGMNLQIPDHLQKDFKVLMNLSYDLKKKNPRLKRNVKFDEENLNLFMDLQLDRDEAWRRIRPEMARTAAKPRKNADERS